jgi:hypothetical protein
MLAAQARLVLHSIPINKISMSFNLKKKKKKGKEKHSVQNT